MIAIAVLIAGFAVPATSSAKDLVLEKYFVGTTRAQGKFSAINGVRKSFTVLLTGKWNGKLLTLKENFTYSDGEKDIKTWRFLKTSPTTYVGTREDVVGQTLVTVRGDTARFSYDVYLDADNRKNRVRFHDTMKWMSNGVLINSAWVSKYGFPVARTRVVFRK
ncbi:DUF3833 family protein [Phyllobacterium lublinensis]|uniref:DUF3833 family protein n=1 Tax=Phyllobacterium lublinensis TaxID=2875708 RepID=UPI001CCBA1F4|nr:DUF3833 family protein [Phyllobacterium sp. 2063]MBZ9653629.1 DUF3833 domain-containing protein [Phyllobacterium sp. 2063]